MGMPGMGPLLGMGPGMGPRGPGPGPITLGGRNIGGPEGKGGLGPRGGNLGPFSC